MVYDDTDVGFLNLVHQMDKPVRLEQKKMPLPNGNGIRRYRLYWYNADTGEGRPLDIAPNTPLRRNHDQQFEKQLESSRDTRKIDVELILSDTSEGYLLQVADTDGCRAQSRTRCEKTPATNVDRSREQIETQLSKTGATIFRVTRIQRQALLQLL